MCHDCGLCRGKLKDNTDKRYLCTRCDDEAHIQPVRESLSAAMRRIEDLENGVIREKQAVIDGLRAELAQEIFKGRHHIVENARLHHELEKKKVEATALKDRFNHQVISSMLDDYAKLSMCTTPGQGMAVGMHKHGLNKRHRPANDHHHLHHPCNTNTTARNDDGDPKEAWWNAHYAAAAASEDGDRQQQRQQQSSSIRTAADPPKGSHFEEDASGALGGICFCHTKGMEPSKTGALFSALANSTPPMPGRGEYAGSKAVVEDLL